MAHRNARLNVFGRELLCRRVAEQRWTVAAAAQAAGVSRTTAGKWIRRYRLEGSAGLGDRSSRPRHLRAGVGAHALRRILRRRRLREGPHRISWETGIARSTVYRVLARNGLARRAALGREARPPALRYEHARPGDLTFAENEDFFARAEQSAATAIIADTIWVCASIRASTRGMRTPNTSLDINEMASIDSKYPCFIL